MTAVPDPRRIGALLRDASVTVDADLPAQVRVEVARIAGRPPGAGTGPRVHVGPALPADAGPRRLLWMHSTNAGVDGLLRACGPAGWPAGTLLTRTVGRMGERIGQYVLGWVLADCQDVVGFLHQHEARVWQRRPARLAAGERAVVFGTGGIGTAIGRALRAVGVRTVGVARTPRPADGGDGRGGSGGSGGSDGCGGFDGVVTLDAVLREAARPAGEAGETARVLAGARWLVNALPLTPATERLLGAELFAAAGGAALINVGRGATVDTDALAAALASGTLRGAVLDVLPEEPAPPESAVWDLPRTVITSHSSGPTTEADIVADFRTAWTCLTTGELPPLTVRPDAGY